MDSFRDSAGIQRRRGYLFAFIIRNRAVHEPWHTGFRGKLTVREYSGSMYQGARERHMHA